MGAVWLKTERGTLSRYALLVCLSPSVYHSITVRVGTTLQHYHRVINSLSKKRRECGFCSKMGLIEAIEPLDSHMTATSLWISPYPSVISLCCPFGSPVSDTETSVLGFRDQQSTIGGLQCVWHEDYRSILFTWICQSAHAILARRGVLVHWYRTVCCRVTLWSGHEGMEMIYESKIKCCERSMGVDTAVEIRRQQ